MNDWFDKIKLGDLPKIAADKFGDREALSYKQQCWTFEEFHSEVNRVARGLISVGVKHGDHVALWMVNKPEWLFLLYATAKIGAVLVPLNTRYRTNDVAYTVKQSDSSTWISMVESGPINYFDMISENLPQLEQKEPNKLNYSDFPKLKRVILLGEKCQQGTHRWSDLLTAGDEIDDITLQDRSDVVNPDDTVIIAYTSGTTGHPKGVMHSHIVIRNVIDRINRFGVTFQDTVINNLPLFHLYGYSESALLSILSGARQILLEKFEAKETLRTIEQESATIIHGFDTHYKDILDAQKKQKRDISSLRLATFPAGMENSTSISKNAQKELVPTISGWGMSETWAFAACSFLDSTEEQRCEASGFPMPNFEFKVINPETGSKLASGDRGELLVRSYQIMKGYYNKPKETAAVIDSDGWMHTGDTAIIRKDGHIKFIGRFKDMLKVGGENVSPAEIEAYLMKIPEIDQVAIVGYPDDRLSEVPVAFIISKNNSVLDIKKIQTYCKGNIASYKIPRYVISVSKFPMTPTGKIQKHKLRTIAIEQIRPNRD